MKLIKEKEYYTHDEVMKYLHNLLNSRVCYKLYYNGLWMKMSKLETIIFKIKIFVKQIKL